MGVTPEVNLGTLPLKKTAAERLLADSMPFAFMKEDFLVAVFINVFPRINSDGETATMSNIASNVSIVEIELRSQTFSTVSGKFISVRPQK